MSTPRERDTDRVRLRHMLDAARRATEIGAGKAVAELDPDSEPALALARLLEIIGEAARRVSPELQSRHPEIPWRLLSGMRNRITHEYFDVDYGIVAATLSEDLPDLIAKLEAILAADAL